jgi:hypothetical protein
MQVSNMLREVSPLTGLEHDLRTHSAGTSSSEHPGNNARPIKAHAAHMAIRPLSRPRVTPTCQWEGKGGGQANHVAFVCGSCFDAPGPSALKSGAGIVLGGACDMILRNAHVNTVTYRTASAYFCITTILLSLVAYLDSRCTPLLPWTNAMHLHAHAASS